MKLYPHTKRQIIWAVIMIVIFILAILYSKGYFDISFIDRQSNLDFSGAFTEETEDTEDTEDTTDYYTDEENWEYEEYIPMEEHE